jgi:sialidase-1
LALLLASTAFSEPSASAPLQRMDIFVAGQGGYHTYRIPALIVTSHQTLLAFCEGRKNSASDTGDIDLLLKRSTDGGKTWSEPQVVWDDGPNTCGNPCPVVDETTGTTWLLLTHNPGDTGEARSWKGKPGARGQSGSPGAQMMGRRGRPPWKSLPPPKTPLGVGMRLGRE